MNALPHQIRDDRGQHGAVISPPTAVIPESNGEVSDFIAFTGRAQNVHPQSDNASPGVEVRIALDIRGRGTLRCPVVCEIR